MLQKLQLEMILHHYGKAGVQALASATPVESGLTAESWDYKVLNTASSFSITWTNSHVVDGRPIAILLQYGHGTGTGGYVEGRDYINPALKPIFDRLADEVWKAVTSA
jgi:hypothetical protein